MFLFVSIAFIYEWNWRAVLWMTYVRLKASTVDRTLSNGLHSQCLKYAQYTADRAVDVVRIFVYATKVTFNKPVDIHSYSKSIFIHAMAYNFFYSSRTLSSIHFFTSYCKTFWTHWGCEKPISNVLVLHAVALCVRVCFTFQHFPLQMNENWEKNNCDRLNVKVDEIFEFIANWS